MAKRVLFVIPSFSIGGTTASLKALLSVLNTNEYEVDVFGRSAKGPRKSDLPNCRILGENVWLSLRIFEGGAFKRIISFILQNTRRLLARIGINLEPIYGRIGGRMMGTESYDAVVSYQEDLYPIVCYYPAKRRVTWIHCEYSRFVSKLSRKNELRCLMRFDSIVCVSSFTKHSLCTFFPILEDKVLVINNCLDVKQIRERSMAPINDSFFKCDVFTIVSAGRLDPVKQFEIIPDIVSKVLEIIPEAKFKWFIIGGGNEMVRNCILQKASSLHIEDYITILPFQENIYPYISSSNLFVHTSSSETFSLVVNEAKVLCTPVLVNNYGCAKEFVKNGLEGWIVPNAEMHIKIAALMRNPEQLIAIKNYLAKNQYDNQVIAKQVSSII